ncbi:di/tricarboxylate transporter [Rhodobium orientis]|nr:SLC13 family permease [Rhodobium orientis]MBB4303188.1 di/tricarboxylate transporter [Rhodobium orientis]
MIVALAGLSGLAGAFVLDMQMAAVLALVVLCIGLWATAAMPEYWTALAFFLIAVAAGIAPADTVFSGFRSSTFWLLFSGIVLGAAFRHTGLDNRLADSLTRLLGARYAGIIVGGLVVFGVGLSFVLPSAMGRTVLVMPIALSLADRAGYGPDSNGRAGILLAAAFGCNVPAFAILPANVPNMILAGSAETLFHYAPAYWPYLLLHFPVLGALKAGLLTALILWHFPDRDPAHPIAAAPSRGPLKPAQRRLTIVLGLCLALWLSDGVHHISPAWIGLSAALYCLWPGSGLTAPKAFNDTLNLGPLFFIAGIVGLGAVIAEAGLGAAIVNGISAHLGFSPDRPLWNVVGLVGVAKLVAVFTTMPGVPAVITPLAEDLAGLTGLPLTTVLMTEVLGFSNILLPYQSPPLLVAVQLAALKMGPPTRLCLSLFAVTAFFLTPLDLLWWRLVGML